MALTAAIEALLVLIDNMVLLLGITRYCFDTPIKTAHECENLTTEKKFFDASVKTCIA